MRAHVKSNRHRPLTILRPAACQCAVWTWQLDALGKILPDMVIGAVCRAA